MNKHSLRVNLLNQIQEDGWSVLLAGFILLGILVFSWMNPAFKFLVPVYQWASLNDLINNVLSYKNLSLILGLGGCFACLSAVAIKLSGGNTVKYLKGFAILFFAAIASLIIAGNKSISYYGLEYVVFALIIGLILGNLFKLPTWLKDAARSEFFIKTGLVILGSSLLFTDIIKSGLSGLIQALVVVAAVWFFALWVSRKLKIDDEFAVMLASAVSICGVSAAIVACGAIKGDKKKLSYVTTLVLLVAIPMMIVLPWLIKIFHIPELVGGAWLGGTLDTTASVTAASELVGPIATKAGVIIKFSQNVLIGLAAFLIAGWWVIRGKQKEQQVDEKPSIHLIWERFPKFVLGFIAASLLFSFIIPTSTGKQVTGFLNSIRTLWFSLAFVSIGLEARFSDLFKMEEGRPAIAFLVAQIFNIIWTLLWAYLLFGGILMAAPDIK